MASRRRAEELITQGRVEIDGVVAKIGQRANRDIVKVTIDGIPLPLRPDLVYYLLYKPVGVISTADDPCGRRTVVDLVPTDPPVYPVGRLDADSEGLILLTNDGDLANVVTHPRYGVGKTYVVLTERSDGALKLARRLEAGVKLEDGWAKAVTVKLIDSGRAGHMFEVVMAEGRNRQVRRMFDLLGAPVTALTRVAIGPIRDRSVKQGSWRHLELAEVRRLYAAANTDG